MSPVIILENEEGVLGKALHVPVENFWFVVRAVKPMNPFKPLNEQDELMPPDIVEVRFERQAECLPVGNHLATVYRQVRVDKAR